MLRLESVPRLPLGSNEFLRFLFPVGFHRFFPLLPRIFLFLLLYGVLFQSLSFTQNIGEQRGGQMPLVFRLVFCHHHPLPLLRG